jgi:hypothetical protein
MDTAGPWDAYQEQPQDGPWTAYQDAPNNGPKQSGWESAGRGALRNIPLAQQVAAAIAPYNPLSDKRTYGEELQHLTEAAEQGKAQNPKSYGAGAVAGTVAPFLAGPLAEGVEAAPIIGNALAGGAQALSDTNLTQKPSAADVRNVVLGTALGAGAGAIGKGIKALAPSEQTLAANSAGAGFGATARNIGKVMGKDDAQEQIAGIGKWVSTATTKDGKPLVGFTTRPAELLKGVQEIHNDAGEAIGKVIDKVSPTAQINKSRLVQELQPVLEDVADINPPAEAQIAGIIKRINKLDESGNLNFDSLQKLKASVGKSIGNETPHMERAYGVLAEHMNGIIDAYESKIAEAGTRAEYEAAKMNYRNASQLLPILRRAAGREIAQGPMGNSGIGGIASLIGGVMTGHPVAGAAGAVGAAVGRPIANMVGRNAALKAVPYMGKVAATGRGLNKAAQLELSDYLTNKFEKKGP